MDPDLARRRDAMIPVKRLLPALGACMGKGIERVVPILQFRLNGAEVAFAISARATAAG